VVVGVLCIAGCDSVETPTCTPLDTPSFTNVYELVLAPSCAVGGSCHGDGAANGGLTLEGQQTAYDALVTDGRVLAGDVDGSALMDRLDSPVTDAGHMPPGVLLSEPERCMVTAWIEQGALP